MSRAARYTTQEGRARYSARPNRESLSKKLGDLARRIKERDGHACVYCGATEETSGAPLHLDHVKTRGMGGRATATNLVTACRAHNSSRKMKTIEAWAGYARRELGLVFDPDQVRAQVKKRLPKKRSRRKKVVDRKKTIG